MDDRISVKLARVYNLGNYESFRVELGYERDIPENSEISDYYKSSRGIVEDELRVIEMEYGLGEQKEKAKENRIANRKPKVRS